MKLVHNKGLNKFISFYLSVLLLVAGMCFNYAETDSFFAYIHNYMNATTLEKTSSTIENANVRTLVTIQRQEENSGISDIICAGRKNMAREFMLSLAPFSMSDFADNSTSSENASRLVTCFNHIAILNYIHSLDGEK